MEEGVQTLTINEEMYHREDTAIHPLLTAASSMVHQQWAETSTPVRL
jgi:hypothetical protein